MEANEERFAPQEGERMIRLVDAYDAIAEFLTLNYGPMVEAGSMMDLFADIYRGVPERGGWPSDESTWQVWVEACERITRDKV